jgi:uncharacterized protein YjiK
MEKKLIKLIVTTYEGELIDSVTLEIDKDIRGIEYVPVTYTMPKSAETDILIVGGF